MAHHAAGVGLVARRAPQAAAALTVEKTIDMAMLLPYCAVVLFAQHVYQAVFDKYGGDIVLFLDQATQVETFALAEAIQQYPFAIAQLDSAASHNAQGRLGGVLIENMALVVISDFQLIHDRDEILLRQVVEGQAFAQEVGDDAEFGVVDCCCLVCLVHCLNHCPWSVDMG